MTAMKFLAHDLEYDALAAGTAIVWQCACFVHCQDMLVDNRLQQERARYSRSVTACS